MICAVVKDQLSLESASRADLIEIRADLLEKRAVVDLVKRSTLPVLLTLRTKAEGGAFTGSFAEYREALFELAALSPAYIDLEASQPERFLRDFASQYPHIKRVHSLHAFHAETDFDSLYRKAALVPADYYKVAVSIDSSTTLLRFFRWAATKSSTLIPVPMGPLGSPGRVMVGTLQAPWSYGCVDAASSLFGQISLSDMLDTYNYKQMKEGTPLYGLIGDPVEASIGHLFHNQRFRDKGLYLKFAVATQELHAFVKEARSLPFKGFSVTMPHKETIMPLLDYVDEDAAAIGAVNTVIIQDGRWIGRNTDGRGCLDAIEKWRSVKQETLYILGTGGSAKAIAYEAKRRGAIAVLVSRRPHANGITYEELPHSLCPGAIVIKCHPSTQKIDEWRLGPDSLCMDIQVSNQKTQFLEEAERTGARTLDFRAMFEAQALLQSAYWLSFS